MNRLYDLKYIFLLSIAFILSSLSACSDKTADDIGGEEEVIIPGRPISFGTGDVSRADQITTMRGKSFGVKAFILDNQWASAGYNATPDPLWNSREVTCDASGLCTYVPSELWQDNKYYSFFGYYPYAHPSVTVSGATHESAPFIEYRPHATDPTQHQDVLVASTFDCTAVNTGQVRLQFSHVLFCLNIAVNNLDNEAVRMENVNFRITSNLYSTYRINMDKSAPVASGVISNAVYPVTGSVDIENTASTGGVNITDPNKFLMLIPQKGLKGKISFTLTKGGQTINKEVDFDDPETNFRPGYRYTINLYFIGDAITLRIIQSNEWKDNDNSIEFD